MSEAILNLEQRLTALEDSLAEAAAGRYHELQPEADDPLAAIELGVNLLTSALSKQIKRVEEVNTELDLRVAERTAELEQQLAERTRQTELIRRQQEAIQELSTPVLQLWDRVIAMPIIGVLDTRRSVEITQKLLDAVANDNARFAILDITGVEVVDTATASHLLQMVRATGLLGATCILTGVQPVVAQTLVSIGVDLDEMLIRRNLQTALRTCLLEMTRVGEEI